MSLLLQVSDTHFGTERPEVVEALVRLAAALSPELVVLSGDITQRARAPQFAAAAAFTARLGAPVLAIPGNHDLPLFDLLSRTVRPYGGYARVFGEDLEPAYASEALLVIGVNTTRPWRHRHGEVSPRQVAGVAARLARAGRGQLRVVVTHHPLHVPPGRDEENLCRGHVRAARAWAAAGADLVLGGHIHLPYIRALGERLPELRRSLWAVQAGTAVSRRVRAGGGEKNSVNTVRYRAGAASCEVQRYDFDAVAAAFVPADPVRIALER